MKRSTDDLFAEAAKVLDAGRRGARRTHADVIAAAGTLGLSADDLVDDTLVDAIAKRPVPALIITKSANRKLAPVALVDVGGDRPRPIPQGPYCDATYLPVRQTCPSSCPFRGHGCMAESGYTGRAVRRLESLAAGMSAREVARAEANEIDRLHRNGVPRDGGRDGKSPRDLRLHVSGDVATAGGLRDLVSVLESWKLRGGGSCWTFTHWWRELPDRWGPISVLASIEDPADAELARARGYAPALTVRSFPSRKAFAAGGTTWIPCPAETSDTTCIECRLCLEQTDRLRDTNRGIAFAAHGPGDGAAKRRLPVIARGAA